MTGQIPYAVNRRRHTTSTSERRARVRRGWLAEWAAALLFLTKGYRVLARRVKTGAGEIDLVAVRGRRLAFIEVKRRRTYEDAEASISNRQRRRIRAAASLWLAKRQRYQEHSIEFDLVLIVPGNWPRHIQNGL